MVQNIRNSDRGSEWRKWDLHVHSPASIRQNYGGEESWEVFISDLEKLPEEFKVIGINDYLFLDGYERVLEYKKSGRLKNIDLILPVLEFRLGEFAGVDFGGYKRPNIHVIFADEEILKIDFIKSQFLATLDSKYKLEKDGTDFQRTLTRNSLKELGQKIIDSAPNEEKPKYETPEIEGFNNLNLKFDQIEDPLNDKDCFKGKYVLAIGKTEWDQLKWSEASIASKKTLINSCKIVFTASESVEIFQNAKTKLSEQKVNDLLLDCSDAHSFSDAKDENEDLLKDRIGNCFTWIKADPTFEGLKQIIYEPNQGIRHIIKEGYPKKPINTIDSITLNVPASAKVGEDGFCFAGTSSTYELSPYFNCFVGGRGSGKSTVLNFLGLHSNNSDSSKKFWESMDPSFDPKEDNFFSFDGTEIFEFLAQSEIEAFAKDRTKFTQAIYDRANSYAGNVLEKYEESVELLKGKLDQVIEAVSDLRNLEEQKNTKEKEKRTLEGSVNVLSSEEYNTIIAGITGRSKELQRLEEGKRNVAELARCLNEFIGGVHSNNVAEELEKNGYEEAYALALTKIGEVVELLKCEKFIDEASQEIEVKENLTELENKARALIEKAGYTPESVEQIKSAPQKISILENEIMNLIVRKILKNKIIDGSGGIVDKMRGNRQEYENKIAEILNPLQELLKKQSEENLGKDVKQISLEYSFNEKGAWDSLSKEFYQELLSDYRETDHGRLKICDFLGSKDGFGKRIFGDDNLENIQTFITEQINEAKKGGRDLPRYLQFLKDIFSDGYNFKIFQAIRDKHLYDVKANKTIQVKYDNRDVEQASFGQRCTAVIVILLLFGNYPLIIDEPEAHLDSSLIANYLVPLLKEKKADRQIIFATHNANFVINGDAEKIFILKNESGLTDIIETTIEDTKNRAELLSLEGGEEAFKKRGDKLNIK